MFSVVFFPPRACLIGTVFPFADAAAWGELLYLFSALFALAAAGCGFLVPARGVSTTAKVASVLAGIMAFSGMTWISNSLYMVDACTAKIFLVCCFIEPFWFCSDGLEGCCL